MKKIKLNCNKFLNYIVDMKNLVSSKSIFYKNGKKIILDNEKYHLTTRYNYRPKLIEKTNFQSAEL